MTNKIEEALEAFKFMEASLISEHGHMTYDANFKEAMEKIRDYINGSGWMSIETAPKDGTLFYSLIDGIPYMSKYDKYGRFIWLNHSNIGQGASYKIHNINGKRLLEEVSEKKYNYQKEWTIWKKGFDFIPTHWMPLPTPPESEEV